MIRKLVAERLDNDAILVTYVDQSNSQKIVALADWKKFIEFISIKTTSPAAVVRQLLNEYPEVTNNAPPPSAH